MTYISLSDYLVSLDCQDGLAGKLCKVSRLDNGSNNDSLGIHAVHLILFDEALKL